MSQLIIPTKIGLLDSNYATILSFNISLYQCSLTKSLT